MGWEGELVQIHWIISILSPDRLPWFDEFLLESLSVKNLGLESLNPNTGFVLTLIHPWCWTKYSQILSSSWWLSQGFITCCLTGCHQMIPRLIILVMMKWLTRRKAEKWHPCSAISSSTTMVNIPVKRQWWQWQVNWAILKLLDNTYLV